MSLAKSLVFAGLHKLVAELVGGASSVVSNLTATGTSQATALALTADCNIFGTVGSSTGARLPDFDVGDDITIVNGGANALSVYPPTGHQINALAANAALSVPAGRSARFRRVSSTRWIGHVSA